MVEAIQDYQQTGDIFEKYGITHHSRTGILPLSKEVMRLGMTRPPTER
jgi:hypothetical protein